MAGSLDRWDRLARSLQTEIDQRLIAALLRHRLPACRLRIVSK